MLCGANIPGPFDDVRKAIEREKQLRDWRRQRKIALIEQMKGIKPAGISAGGLALRLEPQHTSEVNPAAGLEVRARDAVGSAVEEIDAPAGNAKGIAKVGIAGILNKRVHAQEVGVVESVKESGVELKRSALAQLDAFEPPVSQHPKAQRLADSEHGKGLAWAHDERFNRRHSASPQRSSEDHYAPLSLRRKQNLRGVI